MTYLGLYLLLSMGMVACMILWHRKKTEKGEDSASTDFSNATMFFDPLRGEGHLFVGGIITLIFFSLFLLELAKKIRFIY